MSSDLFSYNDPSDVDVGLTIDMNCLNQLTIYVCDPINTSSISLAPDDAGIKIAEQMATALLEWVRHVKED